MDNIIPFQLEPAKVWEEGMNFYYDLHASNKRFSAEAINVDEVYSNGC